MSRALAHTASPQQTDISLFESDLLLAIGIACLLLQMRTSHADPHIPLSLHALVLLWLCCPPPMSPAARQLSSLSSSPSLCAAGLCLGEGPGGGRLLALCSAIVVSVAVAALEPLLCDMKMQARRMQLLAAAAAGVRAPFRARIVPRFATPACT